MTVLTARAVLLVAHHEWLVREAYKDSEGVWTWALGLTSKSGHRVERYRDNPQPVRRCLEVSIWAMQMNYLPDVLDAFDGLDLSESQLAAALSFHWNTGAIRSTGWVKLARAGRRAEAREFLETHYVQGGDLKARRMEEAALFFDGKWPVLDGRINVCPVRKPSYQPWFAKAEQIDVRADLAELLP